MRIILKKGKQKELILLAKKDSSWRELSRILKINENYLRNDLKNERVTLGEFNYLKLCKISGVSFDKHIVKKVDDDWGRSKGGINSPKNIKKIGRINFNGDLAEVFGIILGDGHVQKYIRGKKVRRYSLIIAGNSDTDKDFISSYIPSIFEKVFNLKGSLFFSRDENSAYYKVYGREVVEFVVSNGILPGNKKINNQGIPDWIKKDKSFLLRCIKGLIDTDGSIHLISKKNRNLRINYTSYIPNLLTDVREGLIILGFSPSKIIKERQIFLTSKNDVNRYVKEIGFSNKKNLNRLILLRKDNAPVVQRPRIPPSQIMPEFNR